MTPNPESFLDHLVREGYHPRSDKHSNALAEAIVGDLMATCPAMAAKARAGRLVYDLNFTINVGTSDWNVDLVLRAPPPRVEPPPADTPIRRTLPSTVEAAVELKSIMTEHQKAVRNRKRDLEAHHEHVHRYHARAIAGGVFVVNQAARFRSPLRKELTEHADPRKRLEHCVAQMRSIAQRSTPDGIGLDAKAVIVVEMDNVHLAETHFATRPPAPPVGDPLHYDAFIQALCGLYRDRFGNR